MTFLKSFKKFIAIPPCGCNKTTKRKTLRKNKKRTYRGGFQYKTRHHRSRSRSQKLVR